MKRLILILLVLISVSCQAQFYVLNRNYEEGVKYGYLYNRYAYDEPLSGNQITSSADWRVATIGDWNGLDVHNGGDGVAPYDNFAPYMAIGLSYWNTATGTDIYGLALKGGGERSTAGAFTGLKEYAHGSSVTSYGAFVSLTKSGAANMANGGNIKGRFVCLTKTATGISDGETTIYTGNDGRSYTAIVVNERYWVVNLAETKFRTGSWITGYDGGVYTPISDANWAAKITEAMCAYDDDEGNVFE